MISQTWATVADPDIRVSEVIALKLRRQNSHPYLYPQIFSAVSYLLMSLYMLELSHVLRKRRRTENMVSKTSDENVAPGLSRHPDEKQLDGEYISII